MIHLKIMLPIEQRRILQPLWNAFDAILRRRMTQGIALCVSGGADSRALLEAVARWPRRHEGHICVFSVDHGTRPESQAEANAVVARSKVLGFDAIYIKILPDQMDEATLRCLRYEAIWCEARKIHINSIVTAHHQDDEVESFVMDLFGLGGGHEGSSMQAELQTEYGVILRPFLTIPKKQLLLALTAVDANDYFCDPTNEIGDAQRTTVRRFIKNEFHQLHERPENRIAEISRRRSVEIAALEQEARKICHLREDGDVHVKLGTETSEAVVVKAVMMGLKILLPKQDHRQSRKVIDSIVREGLDRASNSFTVASRFKRFDLSGVRAILVNQGIWLRKEHLK